MIVKHVSTANIDTSKNICVYIHIYTYVYICMIILHLYVMSIYVYASYVGPWRTHLCTVSLGWRLMLGMLLYCSPRLCILRHKFGVPQSLPVWLS